MSTWQENLQLNLATNWESMLESIKQIPEPPSSISDQRILVCLFFKVRDFAKRKFFYPELNRLILREILLNEIIPTDLSIENPSIISLLQSYIDTPEKSILFETFHSYVISKGQSIFDRLVDELGTIDSYEHVPAILEGQTELHQLLRLIQTVPILCKKKIVFSEKYKLLLSLLLQGYNDSYQRDLITVIGNLYASHFSNLALIDCHSNKPLSRMAVRRGVLAHHKNESLPDTVRYFSQFAKGSGSEIHYALQSIDMVLRKRTSDQSDIDVSTLLEITDLCLRSWDHQLQMVSTVCRELFSGMCRTGGEENLKTVLVEINSLERCSKKRFNALFALSGYIDVFSSNLLEEILASIQSSCPSIASACQLLTALLERANEDGRNELIDVIARHVVNTSTDLDLLLAAMSRAKTTGVPPVVLLLTRIRARDSVAPKLILKLMQFVVTFAPNSIAITDDEIILNHTITLFSRRDLHRFLVSNDSSLVASAAVFLLRLPPNPRFQSLLIDPLVVSGGLITLGCCNEDRSIVSNEIRGFFERNIKNASEIQSEFFRALIRESIRKDSLQEESELAMEGLNAINSVRFNELMSKAEIGADDLVVSLMDCSLSSRWRKTRLLAKSIMEKLNVKNMNTICIARFETLGSTEAEEEYIDVIINGISVDDQNHFLQSFVSTTGSIVNPNLCHLTALSLMKTFPHDIRAIISYLCAILVLHSQTVGEDSFSWLMENDQETVSPILAEYTIEISKSRFRGSVDCRGHPICENGNERSIQAWTCARAAVNGIHAMLRVESSKIHSTLIDGLFSILSTLLLSVKHPALIVPIQSCFDTISKLFPETANVAILKPLIDSIGSPNPHRLLPPALRRSQGLGPLVSAVIKSQLNVVFLGNTIDTFLSIIIDFGSCENAIHAINILRSLVRDSTIPERFLEPHIARVMSESMRILDTIGDEFWRIRSAATQLFVQSARRFIGADNEDDWTANNGLGKSKSRKIVAAVEFFQNRNDGDKLLTDFERILKKSDESVIVSVLSVIQSLSKFGDFVKTGQGEVLWDLIKSQMRSSSCHIRRLASRVVARAANDMNTVAELLHEPSDANDYHSILCLLENLIDLGNSEAIDFARIITREIPPRFYGCELVINAVIRLVCNPRVNSVVPQWLLSFDTQPLILQFLCTIDEEEYDDRYNPLVAKHCLELASHPVHRVFVAKLLETSDISTDLILSAWLATGYDYGIALIVNRLEDSRLDSWMSQLDVEDMFDDTKIILASNARFRESQPEKYAEFLMDESPQVRLAACVDGFNCVESLQHVLPKCDVEFMRSLEKFGEYRLAYHASVIAKRLVENK